MAEAGTEVEETKTGWKSRFKSKFDIWNKNRAEGYKEIGADIQQKTEEIKKKHKISNAAKQLIRSLMFWSKASATSQEGEQKRDQLKSYIHNLAIIGNPSNMEILGIVRDNFSKSKNSQPVLFAAGEMNVGYNREADALVITLGQGEYARTINSRRLISEDSSGYSYRNYSQDVTKDGRVFRVNILGAGKTTNYAESVA